MEEDTKRSMPQTKLLSPALVNTHQHAAMSLLRGYARRLTASRMVEKWIWPIENLMTPYDIYLGALLTSVESVMRGTTTVNRCTIIRPKRTKQKLSQKPASEE